MNKQLLLTILLATSCSNNKVSYRSKAMDVDMEEEDSLVANAISGEDFRIEGNLEDQKRDIFKALALGANPNNIQPTNPEAIAFLDSIIEIADELLADDDPIYVQLNQPRVEVERFAEDGGQLAENDGDDQEVLRVEEQQEGMVLSDKAGALMREYFALVTDNETQSINFDNEEDKRKISIINLFIRRGINAEQKFKYDMVTHIPNHNEGNYEQISNSDAALISCLSSNIAINGESMMNYVRELIDNRVNIQRNVYFQPSVLSPVIVKIPAISLSIYNRGDMVQEVADEIDLESESKFFDLMQGETRDVTLRECLTSELQRENQKILDAGQGAENEQEAQARRDEARESSRRYRNNLNRLLGNEIEE